MAPSIEDRLNRALARRQGLIASHESEALRLFHGVADGIDGLVIEQFASILVVQLQEGKVEVDPERLRTAVDGLMKMIGARAAYLKRFVRDRSHAGGDETKAHTSPKPWQGVPSESEFPIREHDLRFLIHPYCGFSVGLFLEHRDNRQTIRTMTSGLRVLNLFSYTCAFSVAAAAGGAREVASVDLSKNNLEWGKRNFAINGLDTAGHGFFCCDVFDFYRRAKRQGRRYDLIVVDPPTFSRARRPARVFVLQARLGELLAGAVELLDPAGSILLSTNDRGLGFDRLEQALAAAARGRKAAFRRLPLPPDFSGDADYARAVLARLD